MKLSKKNAARQRAIQETIASGKALGVIGPNGLYRTCLHSLPKELTRKTKQIKNLPNTPLRWRRC